VQVSLLGGYEVVRYKGDDGDDGDDGGDGGDGGA
jgi:hypothetical protein